MPLQTALLKAGIALLSSHNAGGADITEKERAEYLRRKKAEVKSEPAQTPIFPNVSPLSFASYPRLAIM